MEMVERPRLNSLSPDLLLAEEITSCRNMTGAKGGLVYSLDVTPGVDELEVCFGYPYDRSGIYTKLPIPQRFQCDQMQSFADILNGCSDGMAATIQDGCRIQHALDVIIRSAEEEKWLPCD